MNVYNQFKKRLDLKHENIIQLTNMHIKVDEDIFKTKYYLYLIFEYCITTLENYLTIQQKSHEKISDMEQFFIMESLVNGALYLTEKGLNRGDI